MPATLRRLSGGLSAVIDDECVIVATEGGLPTLVGIAFETRSRGWRCLRHGLADIGLVPTAELAVQHILADLEQQIQGAQHRSAGESPESAAETYLRNRRPVAR